MKVKQENHSLMFPGELLEPSRRAFLELAGFGLSSAALGACSPARQRHLVPGIEGSEDYVAGKSYQVATTCGACSAGCGVLAKCRDGRPIKLEGNPEDTLSAGGLCASGQASLLSLYDSQRLNAPRLQGVASSWSAIDLELRGALQRLRVSGGRVRLLTGSESGPSTRAMIARFLASQPGAEHVSYDALSVSALMDAQAALFGTRTLPSYRFERADWILSFGADFLGTWISPVAHARGYAAGRRPDEGKMSTHVQLEGAMSLSGTLADRRLGLTPAQTPGALAALCALLEKHAGGPPKLKPRTSDEHVDQLTQLAASLWEARGRSLVICGLNDREAQLYASYANHLLGNYGQTLSLARASLQRQGDDGALWKLKAELDAGQVDCLIVSGVNPAYDLPGNFAASLARAGLCIVHTGHLDESAGVAQMVLPLAHELESWGDAEPELGSYRLRQPLLPAFREARSLRRLLAACLGDEREDRELLSAHWREQLHAHLAPELEFERFFNQALHDGHVTRELDFGAEPAFQASGLPSAAPAASAAPGLELWLYPKVGLLDGRHAHNPWLQELPDPVSKVTWDNYACLSPRRAEELGLQSGDLVRLSVEQVELLLPTLVQRGQHDDLVAVALGYGRQGTDRFSSIGPNWLEGRRTVEPGQTVGVNAAPLLGFDQRGLAYGRSAVQLEKAGGSVGLACTQEHHSLELPAHLAPKGHERREVLQSASLASYVRDPEHAIDHGQHAKDLDLWPADHEPLQHHWGMSVDLTSCTGCSACVISCQAENNVPVVGKDEVLRHREMHWMRIDRYFEGHGEGATASYQPMFCQQCDNAPCESVCPVLATVHSSEGLNQQVYNRCVGTRYCANTCPYKVRRFNWFDYPREDKLQNHSLNPDVTVRTRGVMEKCSFCVQRIQEARSEALRRGLPLADGDIQVACQQSCPTQAIVFGDMLDPESKLSKLIGRQRSYKVLEELNVKPSVSYLARIKHSTSKEAQHG